jgi:hypothetical protein
MKIKDRIDKIGTLLKGALVKVEEKRTADGKKHSILSRLNKDIQKRENKKTNYISARDSAKTEK